MTLIIRNLSLNKTLSETKVQIQIQNLISTNENRIFISDSLDPLKVSFYPSSLY